MHRSWQASRVWPYNWTSNDLLATFVRRVRQSLDMDSITTMPLSCHVWAIVMLFLPDNRDTLLIRCSVLNAAARLVTGTHKFDHGLLHQLYEELHWLDVSERIHYTLGVTVHRCLQNKSPEYLVDCCTPVSDIPSRRQLRSATRHYLTIPRYSSALSVVGPSLSQVRRSGTRYQTVSVTRCSPATASDNH